MGEFTKNVKTLFELQDAMKVVASTAKESRIPIKKGIEETQERIKSFMQEKEIDQCNYKEEKLVLKTQKKFGSLTRKTLKQVLLKYFDGSEEKAEEMNEYIIRELGETEVMVLRRVKIPKRKSAKMKEGDSASKSMLKQEDDAPPEINPDSDED